MTSFFPRGAAFGTFVTSFLRCTPYTPQNGADAVKIPKEWGPPARTGQGAGPARADAWACGVAEGAATPAVATSPSTRHAVSVAPSARATAAATAQGSPGTAPEAASAAARAAASAPP